MTEILKAIIFGIVEGITEWLPISSTGHMILLNEFLTLDVSAEFWDMFLVVIQLGAILVPPPAPFVLRLLILPQWPLLPTSGRPDFLWLAVLESDLAVCTQFLGSGRGRRTE